MKTLSSLNRRALVRARGGINKGVTLKQVKAPSLSKGTRRGK